MVLDSHWLFGKWQPGYIKSLDPSIEYLELLGVCMAVFAWSKQLAHRRISIFCDNQTVCIIINNTTSSCKNCMVLVRLLTLCNLQYNMRITAKWVMGRKDTRADLLSHQKIKQFKKVTKMMKIDEFPTKLPDELWPASKLWIR